MNREARYETAFSPGDTVDQAGLLWEVVLYCAPEPGVHYISKSFFPKVVITYSGLWGTGPRWIVEKIGWREHA
jgi:hypothetical protein